MFVLYFFTGDNPELARTICDCAGRVQTLDDGYFVREGVFDSLREALHRMDNPTSNVWVFYPNACIVLDGGDTRKLVGTYMENGKCFIEEEFLHMHACLPVS